MKTNLHIVILVAIAISVAQSELVSCTPLLFGEPPFKFFADSDVNGDGYVDIEDLFALRQVFGIARESVSWNQRADMDQNGIVDIFDVVHVANMLGC